MANTELLAAIREMMQNELHPINKRLDSIDERLDTIDERLDSIDERLDSMDQRLSKGEERVTKIEVIQENVTNKNIQLLFEGQQGMNQKVHQLDRMEMTLNAVKSDVEVMKDVVTEHSRSIRELKLAK